MQTVRLPLVVLLLLLLLRPISGKAIASTNDAGARIVGGTLVDIGSVPYLINLRVGGAFICGGSLVTPTHVVTAAHCVKGVSASRLEVVGGATLLTDATGVKRGVAKVYTPKAYNIQTLHSDVAVLKLKSPLQGNNIATIGLCNSSWKVGELIKVSGWGQITESNKRVSQHVRSVEVALISRKNCISQYRLRGTISTSMFCASMPGKDACDGDSGGPAVYQGQLCGIVSWGIGCARRNSPGVYTSVKTVRSFIDKALNL
ncbi:trypsin alpha-3 [Drosophila albomicans]|uniref:trypsin n=1 Tax=Drosophila albomicans TaxID=7291 RepID=A0A6P8WYS2_DROAB|nr:trypsin alpha-3 [Drosophila albomicans]